MKYKREVSATQSKYKTNLIRKFVTQQCSYNIPIECEMFMKNSNVLRRLSPEGSDTNVLYEVADNYKIELSDNILAVIGKSYKFKNNHAIFTHTEGVNGTTKKLQLKRNDFKAKGSDYEWFVSLYDHNIEGMNFVVDVDIDNKKIVFDLELTSSLFQDEIDETDSIRSKGGKNEIYYGTPGCGKSYLVDKIFNTKENKIFRTVFHPEYSNADFVGQILPTLDDEDNTKIIYKFNEGIFTQALKFAYFNPTISVYLIIEEINRGNASAIFGDIFQLLDRNEFGECIYSIHNENIAKCLELNPLSEIKIPTNLSLIGTMNTSDQNVFTLDTAFKRRWNMKKIRNSFKDIDNFRNLSIYEQEDKQYKYDLANKYVPGSSYTWREFVEKVNAKISEKGKGYFIQSEDKEIGVYFVTPSYLSSKPNDNNAFLIKKFGEKVLMYLWNDVVKTNPEKLFNLTTSDGKTISSLDNLLDEFEKIPNGESLSIFSSNIFFKINNDELSSDNTFTSSTEDSTNE